MTTPTLPGTLPGLLQPGCPVVWLHCDADKDQPCRGWVVETDWEMDAGKGFPVCLVDEDEVVWLQPAAIALDLARPEGVDRALRWLIQAAGDLGRMAAPLRPHIDPMVLRDACLAAGGAE